MKIMVLDCEYAQPSRKTIQIGAAVYDARNAACHGTFETYVNPGEPITKEITHLTGISDYDVSAAPSIIEAFEELKKFHEKHRPFMNPLVWGSGDRNDSIALYEDYNAALTLRGMPLIPRNPNFMGRRVLDAKTLYQSVQIFRNKSYAGGLSECMGRMGLQFEGTKHTALADAKNTFTIWYYLTRGLHDGLKTK
jgi:inhibitor of KinA sporulation pathway (predicted exonuclease)